MKMQETLHEEDIAVEESATDVGERGKQLCHRIKLFGASRPGVVRRIEHQIPPWVDRERVKRAQKVLSSNLFSLDFCALGGLLFGLHDPENMVPLLVTGKSCNIPNLFLRYLSTIHHVRQWYTEDILEPSSPGFRSLMEVRCRHLAAYEKVNSLIKAIPGSHKQPPIWMSQYIMVRAQFAFVGFILLYPRECGLTANVNEYLQELCYLWRVIGYMLGIDDEFNLCSHSLGETIEMCKIYRNELVEQVNTSGIDGQTAGEMAKDIIKSLDSVLLFSIPGDIYLRYWCRVLGVKRQIWPDKKGLINVSLHHVLRRITQGSWQLPRTVIEKVVGLRIESSLKRKDQIFKRFYKKYPQVKFSLTKYEYNELHSCPLQMV